MKTQLLGSLASLPVLKRFPELAWHRPLDLRTPEAASANAKVRLLRDRYRREQFLPRNVRSMDQVPGLVPGVVDGWSMKEVATWKVEPSFLVELDDCWVVRTRYDWGGSEFCVCTSAGRPIKFHGLISDTTNAAMRAAVRQAFAGKHGRIDAGTWVVGYWYNNYYHWLVEFLPRILTALAAGLSPGTILLPPLIGQWAWDSMAAIALTPHWLPDGQDAWRVGRLTLVSESAHHGEALRRVSNGIKPTSIPGRPNRKVWITRKNAVHRRAESEPMLEQWLIERGWEIVEMNGLTLAQQVQLMAETRALAGIHGAGLTNMIFLPPATPIVEIVVLDRPSPEYYALAAALGHPYWLVPARAAGVHASPIHDDVILDLDAIKAAVIEVDRLLSVHA